jgi:iron complex transport system substrate-binding protein
MLNFSTPIHAKTHLAVINNHAFKDSIGRKFTIKKPFERIISLYGAHTENLFSLGASDSIIGVSSNDAYPQKVKEKKAFSYRDDAEKFLAAKPDLILIRPMILRAYPELIQKMEQTGIEVVSLQPGSLTEMYVYWRILGLLTGKQKTANRMIARFKNVITACKNLTDPIEPKKRVYLEAIHDKMKTFTPHAMAAVVLKMAGGINVALDAPQVRQTNIAYYGKERILSKADQIDVYLAQYGVMNRPTIEMIRNEPGFQVVKAVHENQIFIIDEAIISRPTLRLLKGIFTVGRILYPNRFHQKGKEILNAAELAAKEVSH